MDRIETYVGQSILDWCFSKPDQNKMVALGKIISAMFGSNTFVNGLSCTPQSVAAMTVNIAPGEIYQSAQLEATACGSLPSDTAHVIMKQGIALDTVVVPNSATGVTAFSAPGIAGQSVNYLVQAAYADADVSIDPTTGNSPVVLQFYNASNPTSPYQGPSGSGATSNTFRKGTVLLQVKAGTAATTGTQITPSPDTGYAGLWVVTVAYGQTAITAANISQYAAAPILPSSIVASIQSGNLLYGNDTSSTINAVQASFPLPPTSLVDNQQFWVKIKNANTGAMTFTPNAGVIAAAPVVGAAHSALQGGECVANGRALFVWRADIASYVLESCTGGALQVANASASQQVPTAGQISAGSLGTATAGGTANAITASFPASPGAFATGQSFTIVAAASNTGAMTAVITLGGTAQASLPVIKGNNLPLLAGDFPAGYPGEFSYSPSFAALVMQNPATGVLGSSGRLINTIYYSVVTQIVAVTISSPGVFTGALGASSMPQNGSPIVFTTTGALPTGITSGTTYWVINRSTSAGTFQISASQGGSAIATSGTQSGTHTINNPAYLKATNNPTFVITEEWGGGGGSGGMIASTAFATGGGGAGGYARQKIINASLLTSETVTCGAAGTAGTTSGTAGGTGGTSSFGSHSSATGGAGSTGNNTGTSGSSAGGAGGVGTGGDINLTGAAGQNGIGINSYGAAGNGGCTTLGGNGLGGGASTTGSASAAAPGNPAVSGSGSGGGGCWSQSAAEAGATGGSGLVIVYEYA